MGGSGSRTLGTWVKNEAKGHCPAGRRTAGQWPTVPVAQDIKRIVIFLFVCC